MSTSLLSRVAALGLITIGLLGALWTLAPWSDDRGIWQARLAAVPDAQARELLGEIAALGRRGLPLLAEALESPRPAVVLAARQALVEEVDRCELLPPSEAAARLAVVAEALAQRVERYGPEARVVAADLAVRLLRWPPSGDPRLSARITSDCERVLQAGVLPVAADASLGGSQPRGQGLARLRQPRGVRPGERHETLELGDLQYPPLPPLLAATPPALEEPARLPPLADAKPLLAASRAAAVAGPTPAAREIVLTGHEPAPESLADRSVAEVFALWHSPMPEKRIAAEAEFRRRRFTVRQMEVGKGLTDPDPQTRRRWVEALPGLSGIDARPWLLWLSRDEDPGVRSTTMTLMATSGEPSMVQRAEEMARSDADEGVRTLGARLIQKK